MLLPLSGSGIGVTDSTQGIAEAEAELIKDARIFFGWVILGFGKPIRA